MNKLNAYEARILAGKASHIDHVVSAVDRLIEEVAREGQSQLVLPVKDGLFTKNDVQYVRDDLGPRGFTVNDISGIADSHVTIEVTW